MDHPGAGCIQLIYGKPLLIQRNGVDRDPVGGQDPGGFGIAGVFHRLAALAAQKLDQKGEQKLGPAPTTTICSGSTCMPLEVVKVMHNGLVELRCALRRQCVQQGGVPAAQHLPGQLGPGGKGEQGGVHGAGRKIVAEGRGGGGVCRVMVGDDRRGEGAVSSAWTKNPRFGSERM